MRGLFPEYACSTSAAHGPRDDACNRAVDPQGAVVSIDLDHVSIETARKRAAAAGLHHVKFHLLAVGDRPEALGLPLASLGDPATLAARLNDELDVHGSFATFVALVGAFARKSEP